MADYNKITKERSNTWLIKSDIELKKMIDDIRRERYAKKLDEDLISYREILNASFRYKPLIDILREAKINKEKKR